jgi:hypothetical protein
MPKLKPTLSKHRRMSWYASSITWSAFLIWFVADKNLLTEPDTARFELTVFMLVWATVVVLMRIMFRDMKDSSEPTDG